VKTNQDWLVSLPDLLARPDPGPTPFVVDKLLVANVIATVVGYKKTKKTWLTMELALASVTGRAAFGVFEVTRPGPVMLILEESNLDATQRRFDALVRGYGIDPEQTAGLHVSANNRIRLLDPAWQEDILAAAREISPVVIFFDPFTRLKGAETVENEQAGVGRIIDYIEALNDATNATVVLAHHTGHADKTRMRGHSDLEGIWASQIVIEREDRLHSTFTTEHRDADGLDEPFRFKLDRDDQQGTIRLVHAPPADPLRAKVAKHLAEHPDDSANAVLEAVGGNRKTVLGLVKKIKEERFQNHSEPPEPDADEGVVPGSPPFRVEPEPSVGADPQNGPAPEGDRKSA
jgi:hypothetical protein